MTEEEQTLVAYVLQYAPRTLPYVWQVWEDVREVAPMPNAGAAPNSVILIWDWGRRHYECEVFPDGVEEWFYWDRQTGYTADFYRMAAGGRE